MKFSCIDCASSITIKSPEKIFKGKDKMNIRCPKCGRINLVDNPKIALENELKTEVISDFNSDSFFKDSGAYLAFLREVNSREEFPLKIGINKIGRNTSSSQVEVSLGAYVSRYHCCIELQSLNGNVDAVLSDNGKFNNNKPSSNGTFLNGDMNRLDRDEEVFLEDGDQIKIGRDILDFYWNKNNK